MVLQAGCDGSAATACARAAGGGAAGADRGAAKGARGGAGGAATTGGGAGGGAESMVGGAGRRNSRRGKGDGNTLELEDGARGVLGAARGVDGKAAAACEPG